MIEAAAAVMAKTVTAAAVMTVAEGTVMIEAAAAVTAKMVAVTETAMVVMTMVEKAAADGNDGEGDGRW
jgi:hypothetical protein